MASCIMRELPLFSIIKGISVVEMDSEDKPAVDVMEIDEKEGRCLLGSPSFIELSEGRFRCVETGHELPARDVGTYAKSKSCRLALINGALLNKKAPLNFFKQYPSSQSRLICKLTGDIINKSEEHIWKHISGRRFQKRLERMEAQTRIASTTLEKADSSLNKHSKGIATGPKKDLKNGVYDADAQEIVPVVRDGSNSEGSVISVRRSMEHGRWNDDWNTYHYDKKLCHRVAPDDDEEDKDAISML